MRILDDYECPECLNIEEMFLDRVGDMPWCLKCEDSEGVIMYMHRKVSSPAILRTNFADNDSYR